MKALCWYGTGDVRVETVPDPKILHARDAIIKITSTAICGSDLHLFDGFMPTMERGDVLGHEQMGEVVEVGPEVDPSFVITHRLKLDDAPAAYKSFRDKEDGCIKVVLKP